MTQRPEARPAERPEGRPVRLTARGRVAIALAGVLVLAAGVVAVIRLGAPSDCTVRALGRTVELDRDEAERVTGALAVVRRGSAAPSTAAVSRTLDDPSAADAAAVAAAVSGAAPAALTCRAGGDPPPESDRLDAQGLTGRAEAVRSDLRAHFGSLPLGGFAPGGVHTGHMPGSAHYEGRAIDVFFRPISSSNQRHGWALASYLVAHAARMRIATVIFDGRIWTARHADQGWRDYHVDTAGKPRAVARILEHRDHVHVDVAD
jgi:hypothetical protein